MKTTIALALIAATFSVHAGEERFYVGSGRANIELFKFDNKTGKIEHISTAAEMAAPSFLALSPNHRFLYAVSEGQRPESSRVTGFQIDDRTGGLTKLNSQLTLGSGPCQVEVDQSGRDVLVANYNSGSVSVFPIDKHGMLGGSTAFVQDSGSSVNHIRQSGPHAHCIVTDPKDRFAYVCDLGTDKVNIFRFDSSAGTLSPSDPAYATVLPGAGPRHIAFTSSGKFAYVTDEMASTVTVFAHDSKTGELSQVQIVSLLPSEFAGENTAAEVAIDPSGHFVYCSNRGEDSIVGFRCDHRSGRLTIIGRASCGGKIPRHFTIDPSGKFLLAANQGTDNVSVLKINTKTGELTSADQSVSSNEPECILFQ